MTLKQELTIVYQRQGNVFNRLEETQIIFNKHLVDFLKFSKTIDNEILDENEILSLYLKNLDL